MIAYLLLAGTQSTVLFLGIPLSWLWTLSAPHTYHECISFLYTPTTARHLLQTPPSFNECAGHVNTLFPVIIRFRSISNPPTVRGLAQSSFVLLAIHFRTMWIKCGHDWSRFNPHQSSLKRLCGQALNNPLNSSSLHKIADLGETDIYSPFQRILTESSKTDWWRQYTRTYD